MVGELISGLLQGASALAGPALQVGSKYWASHRDWKHAKAAAYQQFMWNRENYDYAALNGPSLQRQGLEKAGYNPLLAVSNGVNVGSVSPASAAQVPHTDLGDLVSSAKGSALLHSAVKQSVNEAEISEIDKDILKNEREISDAQKDADIAEAKLDARIAELQRFALGSDEDDIVEVTPNSSRSLTKAEKDFIQWRRNSLQRSRYTDSKEHAIAEDTVNALHGGSSAFQGFTQGIRNLRTPRRGRTSRR